MDGRDSTNKWYVVMSSDALRAYLTAVQNGVAVDDVMMQVYLAADRHQDLEDPPLDPEK